MTAIECIEAEGLQGATIRNIADQAGVNVAAINYHFGSKEQLLKIVLNTTLNEGFVNNIKDYEDLWQNDTIKALQSFLKDTLQGAVNYPNLTKAHLSETYNKSNYDTNSVQRINAFLIEFHELIKGILNSDDEMESKMAVVQLFSSFMMIGMMPDLFNDFLNIDLKESENQQKFVQTLINNFSNKNKKI